MFKSKKRAITIPQSEHARLAGYLAYHWGNADVAPPPLDRVAFASGVTNHDRGYGHLDSMAIGEVDDATWVATLRRGIQMRSSDPVADTVALMHIRRLLSHAEGKNARSLEVLAEECIASNITQTHTAAGRLNRPTPSLRFVTTLRSSLVSRNQHSSSNRFPREE